jgi:hypothetical protein
VRPKRYRAPVDGPENRAIRCGPELAPHEDRAGLSAPSKENIMKYGLAWLLGIPIPILAAVYLISHC